jgi:hypothetical protein
VLVGVLWEFCGLCTELQPEEGRQKWRSGIRRREVSESNARKIPFVVLDFGDLVPGIQNNLSGKVRQLSN